MPLSSTQSSKTNFHSFTQCQKTTNSVLTLQILLLPLMVPQETYIENLTTPHPPPPSRSSVRRDWNISWRYENERKNLNFHFFQIVLWTPRNYFFLTTLTQKITMMSKIVAQHTKKTKIVTFCRKIFLSYVPYARVECSFDKLAERFSSSYRKLSPKLPKMIYLFFPQKTFFLKFVHLTCTM